jgi:hypothetical protein
LPAAAVLLPALLWAPAHGGFACGSLQVGVCLRANTLSTLRTFARTAPESASAAACCAACAAALPNCTAWQLGQSASLAASPDCALLRDAPTLSSALTRVCNSSVMVPAERVGRAALSGVWMQHGDLRSLTARGFLIGADLVIKWSTVEPADGVFDWSSVTSELSQADAAEFYMQAALQTGPDAPAWVYARAPPAASVPLVNITPDPGHEDDTEPVFPYYLDSTYQALFLRVQRAFADYLARLPTRLRRRIVSGQAMYGQTTAGRRMPRSTFPRRSGPTLRTRWRPPSAPRLWATRPRRGCRFYGTAMTKSSTFSWPCAPGRSSRRGRRATALMSDDCLLPNYLDGL